MMTADEALPAQERDRQSPARGAGAGERIARVEASLHEVAVPVPLLDGRTTSWRFVLCRVEAEDGLVGHGLTGRILAPSIVAAIRSGIAPLVIGLDPFRFEAIHTLLGKRLNARAYTGVISNALAAFDIALHDLVGRRLGRPVAHLLGGARDSVPAYATFGLDLYDRDELCAAARHFASMGFRGLKMVVGRSKGGWREDVARVRAVRAAIGEEMPLMIDANYGFPGVEARHLANAVEDCGIAFFEEPVHQNDARTLADLRRATTIPIAAGQMEGHRWRHRELVEREAIDILQPNCCYNGGYTETRKIAHLAQAYNLPLDNGGGWPAFNLHTMAGLANGGSVEYHAVTAAVTEVAFPDAPRPAGGAMKVPDAPGLGFSPDEAVLRDTRVEADA
ncbi:mandelate racemase/muconate lactonizing enzyme family protein [Acuticoccus kandeliae]|uniref:mandelate racemase/muconate lactonizing enzyme family protein n=1 Tax=Acuticoccus kandeliae TaxID=2073160 RepID=UPI00196B1C73|nr:mandelate racemase/muconate lactonizing enzyme family protein [Acuticoccus kandeliae]